MLLSLWPNYWEDWELQHKVIFDGVNKLIYIAPSATEIDIEADLYSSWKEWVLVRENSQYEAAMRTVGGDPTSGGNFLGGTFFLINGWQIFLDHGVDFTGNLFSDDFDKPATVGQNQQLSSFTVSNLIDKIKAVDLDTVNVDGNTLEQALKAMLAVLAGKQTVAIGAGADGGDKVEFLGQDGTTVFVDGTVKEGIRIEGDVKTENL